MDSDQPATGPSLESLIAVWESDAIAPETLGIAVATSASGAARGEWAAWREFLRAYAALRAGDRETTEAAIDAGRRSAAGAAPRVTLLIDSLDAFSASIRGDHARALAGFEAIAADRSGALTPFDRAVINGNHGTVLWLAGKLPEATRKLMDSLATMRGEGRRQRTMVILSNLGQLLVDIGDPASALDIQRELAAMPEAATHVRIRVVVPALAMALHLARRAYADAYRQVAVLESVLETQVLVESESQIPAAAAEACLRQGEVALAQTWLARGDALIDPQNHRRAFARQERVRALLQLRDGNVEAAREKARAAEAILARENYPLGWSDALETLAECEEACGDLAAALKTRKWHVETLRQLGDNANRSRHYLLETQHRVARMRDERDRAQADGALMARHAGELEAVNRRLAGHLSELEVLRGELAEQAVRDALTGLYNRRRIGEAWERVAAGGAGGAGSDHRWYVALIDIDHFKRVNDEYGHAAGDEVLKRVAMALQRAFRAEDLLVRYGGEEFCVICEAPSAGHLCDRLDVVMRSLGAHERREAGAPPSVTFSGGVARVGDGESFEGAAARADAALYRAKSAGRARVFLAEEA